MLMIVVMWNPHRHPILANTPPSVKPREKPIGCPPPIDAKAIFLLRPGGKEFVTMLTADGRQNEDAMPANARNSINWAPVSERPLANVKALWRTQPVRYMTLLPTTSLTDPDRRSVHPHVRANIEAGLCNNPKDQFAPLIWCEKLWSRGHGYEPRTIAASCRPARDLLQWLAC